MEETLTLVVADNHFRQADKQKRRKNVWVLCLMNVILRVRRLTLGYVWNNSSFNSYVRNAQMMAFILHLFLLIIYEWQNLKKD